MTAYQDMARYKENLKNSHLLEEFFQSWSNLTPAGSTGKCKISDLFEELGLRI